MIRGIVALALALAFCAPASALGAPSTELERYAPTLRYDAAEDYFAQPVSPASARIDRDVVYGHEVRDGVTRFLQYWLYYPYNDQDRGLLATGRHEGDWEFVQVRLEGGEPEAVTFAQHSTAERCGWDEVEASPTGGPVVYVANGSHASYRRAGTVDRPWPDPNDEAGGDGAEVEPELVEIHEHRPAWVADPMPWGDSEEGWFPGEQGSPPGPAFQEDDRWDQPAAYEAAARACGEPPPGGDWQAPAVVGLVLAGIGFTAIVVWRRRRRRATP